MEQKGEFKWRELLAVAAPVLIRVVLAGLLLAGVGLGLLPERARDVCLGVLLDSRL